MFGFLLRIAVIAALVVGGMGYLKTKNISFTQLPSQLKVPTTSDVLSAAKSIDTAKAGKQVSDVLDALVTHPGRNLGPVVLGVQVTNESLGAISDALLKLKPEQLQQIQAILCQPVASPSAQ